MLPKGTKRILIVDNEPEICDLLSGYLNKEGFSTDVANNGREALDIIAIRKPDLISLDEVMPVMSGFELLSYLRSKPEYSRIPVIMLTSRSGPHDLDMGITLKADFYLPKPFDLENFMSFVNLMLGEE